MFFFGIFGLDSKIKEIGKANNIVCPSCNALTSFSIYKAYSYFHIFFIPTFRWNVKYIAKSACCSAVYALREELGRAFTKGKSPDITPSDLTIIENGRIFLKCRHCARETGQGFFYCPYCGKEL